MPEPKSLEIHFAFVVESKTVKAAKIAIKWRP
jgi:hypothetical protein